MRSLRFIRYFLALLVVVVGLLSIGCADAIRITPTTQRVIIQRPTVMFRLKGEQRLQENVGKAFPGDTLLSFATAIAPTEAGDRYLFYIVWGNIEAWFDDETGSQAGKRAVSEYEAVTSVCDTKFIMPAENDSTVWKRALEYVNSHTSDIIQYATPTLIQTSKRNRLPNGISFIVRRTPQSDGSVQYSVRANDSSMDLNARKCAFFMQTGRDERQYYGIKNITRK
jgi:hypothetical protein